ncbi:TPA: hypothetical protein ACGF3M_003684, partial [Vibrio cholerae]
SWRNMGFLTLNSYQGLLKKCDFEYQMLSKTKKNPEYEYHVFNLVMGLNHLFEWYLKDKQISEQKKIACIASFNPFSSDSKVSKDFKSLYSKSPVFPEVNREQEVVRHLCNNAKHFKSSVPQNAHKNFTAVMGKKSVCIGNKAAMCGSYSHFKYSVSLGDKEVDVVTLLGSLLEQWESFVAKTA